MAAVYSLAPTSRGQFRNTNLHPPVKRIEPCLDEAKAIVAQIQTTTKNPTHQRFRQIFTALADGDTAVGLLAYYLWRRHGEQQPLRSRR